LAGVLKFTNGLVIQFSDFFSGRGEARITETADNELVNTGARLYLSHFTSTGGVEAL
jgi:hypothetical protein